MLWILAGFACSALYVGIVSALAGAPVARLWAGNIGLLVAPVAPILVVLRRRRSWRGRHVVFMDALAVAAALWLGGQMVWGTHELLLNHEQPWLSWDIVPQLCGSLLPLLALVAAPHRGQRRYSAATSALDIYGLALLIGYVQWSLVIAPGLSPGHEAFGLRAVAVLGPATRVVVLVGLLIAVRLARETPWARVYALIAAGTAISLVLLLAVSTRVIAGVYHTGSFPDVAWILPFWFYAAAAAGAPASAVQRPVSIVHHRRPGSPLLLFSAVVMVPVVSLVIRALVPLDPAAEKLREIAEDLAMIGGVSLAIVRVAVEQRIASRSERRVRLLAAACEQTSELIVITQGERIDYANAACCRALGFEADEIRTIERRAVVPEQPDDAERLRKALENGESVSGMLTLKRRDGSTFPAAIAAAPLAVGDAATPFVVAVVRDLTDELSVREQLVRGERLSAMGELVSSIAQQLNDPLQSVVGTIDVLLATPGADHIRVDLERVRLEAWRAGHIIRNLLAFARKSPGERLLGELNEIVQAAVALCAYQLEASHVKVVESYSSELPLVLVSRDAIQQAVLNLVTNAQQSLAAGGRAGTVTVRTFIRGTDAVLEIADDGPGLPPEIASRIFEPFVTTKRLSASAGFGLSTAFGIVTSHGGTLELVPSPTGACFRLMLPGAGFAGPVVRAI